jgi:hypothetical protein
MNIGFSRCPALGCIAVRDRANWLREHYESAALTAELRARAITSSYIEEFLAGRRHFAKVGLVFAFAIMSAQR